MEDNKDLGREDRLSQAEPQEGLRPSGFDPSRVRLLDLSPRISSPEDWGTRYLRFLCPVCRHHEIGIYVSAHRSGDVVCHREDCGAPEIRRVWAATQIDDLAAITLTPSINRQGLQPPDDCGGWHGHITGGLIQ